MLASLYPIILALHIGCVAASGSLFLFRGIAAVRGSALAWHPRLRRLSHLIDSLLLLAAIGLMQILHQYPLQQAWLSTKVLLLLLYIALGMVALRQSLARTPRALALLGAVLVFVTIIGVALHHQALGWLA